MTPGYAQAKSGSRTPEIRVARAKCARAVVSTSKMSSVICLDDFHLWAGLGTPVGAPLQVKTDRRGDDLAVTVTQGPRAQCIR